MELGWQTGGLPSENQHDVWRLHQRRVPEDATALCREKVWVANGGEVFVERTPTRPYPRLDVFPIIEPGALHLALMKRKPERLDEVQRGARSQTGPARVPGVPMNFGMHEDDVCRQVFLCLLTNRRIGDYLSVKSDNSSD